MKQNKIIFNFFLITCLSINTSILFGQHSLIITIKDSVTTEPLRFATAYFKENNHIGFVTDLNGQFIIDASNLSNLQDSIICSFIGYEEKLFPLNLLAKKDLVIYLSPKTILLQEVEVTSKKSN